MLDDATDARRSELKQEMLRDILNMRDIPTLPTVMHRILQTVGDENASPEDLTGILENDPAISTSVLRLANSAFYGLSKTVNSIKRAVVLIGFDAVEMLALATGVLRSFSDKDVKGFRADDFWMHALGCGKASQIIAVRSGQKDVDSVVFTTGLLHDIGKFLFALAQPEKYSRIISCALEEDAPIHLVEQRLMGIDHSNVAAWVCGKWLFPSEIVEPIRYQFYDVSKVPADWRKHVEILQTADKVAMAADFGSAGDAGGSLGASDVPEGLGLSFEDLLAIRSEIAELKDETREVLNSLS